METYDEFIARLQKRGSKPFKISRCLGARDAWKWVRHNKWEPMKGMKVSSSLYGSIVKAFHIELIQLLLEGKEIEFPYQMGSLKVVNNPVRIKERQGKIYTNYRMDWPETLKCWYENPELGKKRIPVKRVQSSIYSIRYSKQKARYKHFHLYSFRPNRSLVRTFWGAVENGEIKASHLF
jgi:hypothetical protein